MSPPNGSLDHLNLTSTKSTEDATFPTSGTPTSSSAAEIRTTSTPSDTTLNPVNVDAPPVSQLREAPVDQRVVALRAMFPDYDDLILQSVLDSVGGNQDQAIDALLGMSDPNYKSERRPEEPPARSQTELDEEFARQLMLEDQEGQQQAWIAQQSAQYQQRQSQRPDQQPPPGAAAPGGGGDTVGQQFSKIAESGKRTFGNLFSKVKAKIQEFDQPKPAQGSDAGTQPTWGPYNGNQYQPAPQGSQPYPVRRTTYPAPQMQPAYYDPNGHWVSQPDRSPSPPIVLPPHPRASAVQGYDVTPDSSSDITPPPGISTATGATDSPTRPQGAPIDGGKLGLLPKRPVSLLRTQDSAAGDSPYQVQRSSSEGDSDDLEYAESPFEERKK